MFARQVISVCVLLVCMPVCVTFVSVFRLDWSYLFVRDISARVVCASYGLRCLEF